MPSGFFLKEKPPRTLFARARFLCFRSNSWPLPTKSPLPVGRGLFSWAVAQRRKCASGAEQQHAGGFFVGYGFVGAYGAVEELVDVEIDLEEGWARGDCSEIGSAAGRGRGE